MYDDNKSGDVMSVLGQNAYNRSQHHKKIMLQGTGKNKQGSVQDKQKG